MEIDATELDVIAATLYTSAGRLGAKGSAALRKVAFDTVAGMQQQIEIMEAIDSGDMRNSVNPPEFRGDGRMSTMEAEIGPTVDYAQYVHDGTDKMAPRPFTDAPAARARQQLTAAYEHLSEDIL